MPGLGAEVDVRCGASGRHQERVACVQGEGGLVLDHHLHGAGEDVADLLAGVLVPAGLDAGGDLGEHLDDLASGDRGCVVLEFGALEFRGERIDRLVGRIRLPPARLLPRQRLP